MKDQVLFILGDHMRYSLAFLLILFVTLGCGRSVPGMEEIQQPIRVTSFPMPDDDPAADEAEITVLMQVMPDGSVANAVLIKGWITEEWNQTVIDSLLTWRFSALEGGSPEGRWHRRDIKIMFEEPFFFNGGIFRTDTRAIADSLHRLLMRVNNLETQKEIFTDRPEFKMEIAKRHDITNYPHFIRRQLRQQRTNSVTRPMLYDGRFILFYRVPHPDDPIQSPAI